ncbi:hypothetical protein AN958_00043 [Leucoagaricus sp. SymC.cos]|nr:hypothetical protein AN958_00043 [Leucoagaricus sp. SymC.cos]
MGYLQSSFIPTPVQRSAGATQKCVEISFIRARTTCDPATGLVDIMWPVGAEPETGLLCIDVFAAGATKKVHQVSSCTQLSLIAHQTPVDNWH